MEYILVGVGGVFGAITRYLLGKWISSKSKVRIPLGTLIINISGALLLGVLTRSNANNTIYLILGEGFLGAYTTFSTFMYEGFKLFEGKDRLNACIYILSSVVIGITFFYIGMLI